MEQTPCLSFSAGCTRVCRLRKFSRFERIFNPESSLLQEAAHACGGRMQYVWDEMGKRYLDGLGGIVTISVGHCHPYVVDAIRRQNETLQHSTTIYLHPNVAEYARALASRMPGDLKVCYFVNSGSEANDLALLMARVCTGNFDVIALRNAYHGGNSAGLSVTAHSTWKFNVAHSFGVHYASRLIRIAMVWTRRR
jgi:alanine-glyoxylate transaminase/(R)-3-amino-2-methylpropionate-pyruvate transaminase